MSLKPLAPIVSVLLVAALGCGPSSHITSGSSVPSGVDPYVTAAGALSLGSGTYSPVQNAGSFSFAVTRTSGSTGAVSVQYATADVTAMAGVDYTAQSGTLSWADGDSSTRTITVPYLDATLFTGTRQFNVNLSNPTGGAVLNNFLTTYVIVSDTYTPPAPAFNFNNWKLQLPVDLYGGTGGAGGIQYAATEVTTGTLNGGFSDPYFYLNTSNQIVFTAPATGAVTTPGVGSDHTRSELRELYTGAGADSNSDWNSTIGGTMTATVQVASVAPSSDEATIGQIHGQNNTFFILSYRPAPNNDISVYEYASPTATSSTRTTVFTGPALNDKLTYTINYSGNTITVTVNDVTKSLSNTLKLDATAWAGQSVYFKVGAYHAASNTGTGQTQVAVSSFAVTHP